MANAQNFYGKRPMPFKSNHSNERLQLPGGIVAGAVGILAGLQLLNVGYGVGLCVAMALGLVILQVRSKASPNGKSILTAILLSGSMFSLYYVISHFIFQLLVSLWSPLLLS